ncbi:ankyrin repeat-containing domain protein [Achaetomium macrosporum]|uniref:Ankyrin repeat-containing domain protein n=1 Tax=Achaetomium macrosporum TaxID=79813 RepID=A0AAN7H8F1_9PEZI|nr:ankyrin repeat-containing domain protein [Achaetomium macrosporum]
MADVVQALLDASADPLAVDNKGHTPLHWLSTFPGAFDEPCRQAYTTLTHLGPAAITTQDKQGRTPLHLALPTYSTRAQPSTFAITHLLSLGADPAHRDPLTGNTALHFLAPRLVGESAAAATTASLFRSLVTTNTLDINARNNQGETPAFTFAAAGWSGMRDPTHRVSHPTYALAHDTTHAKALDIFITLGADLKTLDSKRRTLLHVTAGRELPTGGADWDQREDIEGMFQRLIELGVDPRAEDEGLRTAVNVAIAQGLTGVVELFGEETGPEESGGTGGGLQ